MLTDQEREEAYFRKYPKMLGVCADLKAKGCLQFSGDVPDDDDLIVIAGTEHGGLAGSRQARCECNVIVWLTPETQRMLANRKASHRLLCTACAARVLPQLEAEEAAKKGSQ